ncbi:ABC transporter permease [Paenibacillus sp. YYML68]|uniref:ABC transporter permease n=1 Tax=Paenibacillus sp. YYML68 TaxID=2909250 RepID=UPI0024915E9A|nr:hypothetical protein [Paenibacillus sp. YYML68]
MLGIVIKEYTSLIKGIKSMLLAAFITLISIWAARFITSNALFQSEVGSAESTALAGLSFILVAFGALFVYILSHDIINRDIELQRIRLLVTKTSRRNIVLGKFLAVWLFWLSITTITFVIVSIMTKTFLIQELLLLWVFLAFHTSVVVLVSTLIVNHAYTVMTSLILGIAMPIAGVWSMFNTTAVAQVVRYGLPYYFMSDNHGWLMIAVLEALLMLVVAVKVLERKEL